MEARQALNLVVVVRVHVPESPPYPNQVEESVLKTDSCGFDSRWGQCRERIGTVL